MVFLDFSFIKKDIITGSLRQEIFYTTVKRRTGLILNREITRHLLLEVFSAVDDKIYRSDGLWARWTLIFSD
jgi:hypothetical protein